MMSVSWNPAVGCTKYSDGCINCYAEPIALRLAKQGNKAYKNGFRMTLLPERLDLPYSWKKPRNVFVNSMFDLFHRDMPEDYIQKIFSVVRYTERHTYMALTKRSGRLAELAAKLDWPENLMMGVTIESDKYRARLDDLKKTPAAMKFVCIEPLVGRLKRMDFKGLDWVVLGGESGPCSRPMETDWVRDVRDWCAADGVPFYFKQYSEYDGYKTPLLDGKYYREKPVYRPLPDLFG